MIKRKKKRIEKKREITKEYRWDPWKIIFRKCILSDQSKLQCNQFQFVVTGEKSCHKTLEVKPANVSESICTIFSYAWVFVRSF